MPEVVTFSRDIDVETLVAELHRNGCAIVAELADADTVARLRDELQPYLDDAPLGKTEFAGRTSKTPEQPAQQVPHLL